jgi:hypothetical protein
MFLRQRRFGDFGAKIVFVFFPAIFVYAATETCWLALFSCTTIVLFLVLEAALASSSSWQKIMT